MKLTGEIKEYYNQHRPLGPQPHACYAPFKNLYFGSNGHVVACCFNRSHVLGTYPEQSINEIWNGVKATELRTALANEDFSNGCHGCYNQIVAKNIDGTKAHQYDERPLNENGYPSVMEFELTNLCNLECEMCSGEYSSLIRKNRENKPPLPMKYDDLFVKQLEEFIPHLETVKFYGGEPFLVEIYYKIWRKIIELNPSIHISVQTNATILNNRVKNILKQSNFHLNISIDSLSKDSYEKIRKNAKLERVIDNILWFREYTLEKNTFFGISACAMTSNWKELPKFVRFCNALNAQVYFHNLINPLRLSMSGLSDDQLGEAIIYLSSFDFRRDSKIAEKNRKHYLDYITQLDGYSRKRKKSINKPMIFTFDGFLSFYSIKILKDSNIDKNDKEILLVDFREKINYLNANINNDIKVKEYMKSIEYHSNTVYEAVLGTIKDNSKEDLLNLFRTYDNG